MYANNKNCLKHTIVLLYKHLFIIHLLFLSLLKYQIEILIDNHDKVTILNIILKITLYLFLLLL